MSRKTPGGLVTVCVLLVVTALSGIVGPRNQVNAATSISLDEPFTGATLVDPLKWISMSGGTLDPLEWPCLTAASTAVAVTTGTVAACQNQNGGAPVSSGAGAMRLTRLRPVNDPFLAAGSLLYTDALSAAEGIDITFSIRSQAGSVADGMSFFLKDGSNASNNIGGAGGSMGYGMAHNVALTAITNNGVPGALFGIGFDRYGNFSWNGVGGADCGAARGAHNNQGSPPASAKNQLVLRGSDTSAAKDGSAGFCLLKSSTVAYADAAFQRVRVKVESYTPGSPTTVSVYLAAAATPTILPLTPTLTETMTFTATTFKFGFSAATGWWSNNHDIRDLSIRPEGPAVTTIATSAATGSGTGPTSGGTTLTITGTNIDPAATVTVDGESCTSISVNGGRTELTCVTPAGSVGAKQVVITNPNGGPAFGSFTYVNPTPTVTAVSPSSGVPAGGNTVTVTGTGFVSGATVTFGGQSCTSVNVTSDTSLTCVVPAGTDGASVNVVVTNTGPVSGTGAGLYTYRSAATPTTTTTTTTIAPTTTTTTTVPRRLAPVLNQLTGVPFRNSSFNLVASPGDDVVTLESRTPGTCRVQGASVLFVGSGRCSVQVVVDGSLAREFSRVVRHDSPDNAPDLASFASRSVFFAGDSAEVQRSALSVIRRILPQLRNARLVTVTGHAADAGDPNLDVAMDLSVRRTLAIAAILRDRGIDVTVETSFGKTRPTSSDRAKNRRVDIAWHTGP